MMTLTIISMLIFVSYVVYAYNRFGITPDLSSTFYLNKQKWLFPAMLGVVAMLLLIPIMSLRDDEFKLFEFLTIIGVIFTASAPAFREDLVREVHRAGAIVSGASAVIVMLISGCWWLAIGLIPLFFIKKNRVYWVELYLFMMIYTRLLIN